VHDGLPDDAQAAFEEGVRRFDAGAWFEAHEAWESRWRRARGAERARLQGLILAAAALLQHERGVDRGAARLWRRARAKLESAEGAGEAGADLDVARFVVAMESALAGSGAPPRLAALLGGSR
jgi:hypothetical protein